VNPDVYDASCDYCGHQVGQSNLRIIEGMFLCEPCRECRWACPDCGLKCGIDFTDPNHTHEVCR